MTRSVCWSRAIDRQPATGSTPRRTSPGSNTWWCTAGSGSPCDDYAVEAEAHRLHIQDRFYDVTPEFHRGLGDMYIADPRLTKTYEDIKAGMAQYVRDAIHANADRAARVANDQS